MDIKILTRFKPISHTRTFLYGCQIVAIILTYQQVAKNVRSYYQFESTLTSREYGNPQTLPFPNILICSKSMHSRMKRKYII